MISKASVRFVRISPRKVRYVIDLIRKKSVPQAQAILNGSPRRAGGIVQNLLNQAINSAERNSHVHAKDLIISKVTADGGPSMRRFRAASMGRASIIRKRTAHIQLELDLAKHTPVTAAPKKEAKPVSAKTEPAAKTAKRAPKKETNKKLAGAK